MLVPSSLQYLQHESDTHTSYQPADFEADTSNYPQHQQLLDTQRHLFQSKRGHQVQPGLEIKEWYYLLYHLHRNDPNHFQALRLNHLKQTFQYQSKTQQMMHLKHYLPSLQPLSQNDSHCLPSHGRFESASYPADRSAPVIE